MRVFLHTAQTLEKSLANEPAVHGGTLHFLIEPTDQHECVGEKAREGLPIPIDAKHHTSYEIFIAIISTDYTLRADSFYLFVSDLVV